MKSISMSSTVGKATYLPERGGQASDDDAETIASLEGLKVSDSSFDEWAATQAESPAFWAGT